MAKFKCKDMGMKCGFEIKDENRDELMSMISTHAAKTHNITQMTPEMQTQLQKAIKK